MGGKRELCSPKLKSELFILFNPGRNFVSSLNLKTYKMDNIVDEYFQIVDQWLKDPDSVDLKHAVNFLLKDIGPNPALFDLLVLRMTQNDQYFRNTAKLIKITTMALNKMEQ